MADIKGHWVENPAAIAWEWESHYADFPQVYRHQLVWDRGSQTVLYGTKVGDRNWVTTKVTEPSRLGFDGTLRGFKRLVEAFFTKEEEKV